MTRLRSLPCHAATLPKLLLPLLFASACAAQVPAPAPPATAAPGPATNTAGWREPAQLRDFPRDRLAIDRAGGRDEFHVWLADTPERSQQGLMFVRELPADRGMLFLLANERVMSMWMKNTYIPLDMLFIGRDGRIVSIAAETTPLSTAIVESGAPVYGVLELRGGEARRRGIAVGDLVRHAHFQTRR
jgi:uncharacterized protein